MILTTHHLPRSPHSRRHSHIPVAALPLPQTIFTSLPWVYYTLVNTTAFPLLYPHPRSSSPSRTARHWMLMRHSDISKGNVHSKFSFFILFLPITIWRLGLGLFLFPTYRFCIYSLFPFFLSYSSHPTNNPCTVTYGCCDWGILRYAYAPKGVFSKRQIIILKL